MATETAGVLKPESNWGLSLSIDLGGVFEMAGTNTEGQDLAKTGNGVLSRAKVGANWNVDDGESYNGTVGVRFGASGSRVTFPEVPHGQETRYEQDTRVGGFAELDYAFPGPYSYFFDSLPGRFGFRLGLFDEYSVDGPLDGSNLIGAQLAIDVGTRWFNVGPLVGYAFSDGRIEGNIGFQFSSPIFGL